MGDVSSAKEAVAAAEARPPDVVLLDISTEPGQAREVALTLARLPSAPTVVVTSSGPPAGNLDGFVFIAKSDVCARDSVAGAGFRSPPKQGDRHVTAGVSRQHHEQDRQDP